MADTSPSASAQVVNAAKLVGDVGILPGVGQLAEGKITEGVLYGVGGLAVKTVLAPVFGPLGWIAWVALGLDSYAKSASGTHLWEMKSTSAPAASPARA